MSGKATKTLADLCELITVQVDPRGRVDDEIYVGLEHLAPGRFVRRGAGTATDVQSSKYTFQPGDVLYSKLRPYLDKAVLTTDAGICTTELLVLRPKEGVDPRFLIGVVHAPDFVAHAVSRTTGVQHPRTSWNHIIDFELPVYGADEQTRIADLLWKVHSAITAGEELLEAGANLRRVAMRAMFTRGLKGTPQKETEIGLIPESWAAVRLDQKAKVISTRMSYSELEDLEPAEGKDTVKVLGIKVADMNSPGNEVELKAAALEKFLPLSIAQRRCAPPRAIIFPKRGAAIATNKKRVSGEWTVFDPNVIGVVGGNELDQDFLFQWFQTFDLRTITEPGPTPQLNKKNLDPLLIPLPPTTGEQQEIVTMLKAIDRKIELQRKKQTLLDEVLQSLLHKLITGEISLADRDWASSKACAVKAVA